jgi:hypothetical protein
MNHLEEFEDMDNIQVSEGDVIFFCLATHAMPTFLHLVTTAVMCYHLYKKRLQA